MCRKFVWDREVHAHCQCESGRPRESSRVVRKVLARSWVLRDEKVAAVLVIRVGYEGEGGINTTRKVLRERGSPRTESRL